MMQSPEFVTAEVAYRTQQISAQFRAVRRRRTLLSYLDLRPQTEREQLERVQPARSQAGMSNSHARLAS